MPSIMGEVWLTIDSILPSFQNISISSIFVQLILYKHNASICNYAPRPGGWRERDEG